MTGAELLQLLLKIATHPATKEIAQVVIKHASAARSPPVHEDQPDVQAKAESYSFGDLDKDVEDAEIVERERSDSNDEYQEEHNHEHTRNPEGKAVRTEVQTRGAARKNG